MDIEKFIIKDTAKSLPFYRKYLLNKSVVDIGCGTGIGALYISKECHAKYYLFDYEDLRVKKAKKLPFTQGSMALLPFKDKEFDVAYIQFVLHHLNRNIPIKKALSEALRVANRVILIEEVKTARTDPELALKVDKENNALLHPNGTFEFTRYYTNKQLITTFHQINAIVTAKKLFSGIEKYGNLDIYLYNATKKD